MDHVSTLTVWWWPNFDARKIKWHGSTVRQTSRWAYETVMLTVFRDFEHLTQLSIFECFYLFLPITLWFNQWKYDAFSCKGLRRCPFDLTSYCIPCFCGLPWSYKPLNHSSSTWALSCLNKCSGRIRDSQATKTSTRLAGCWAFIPHCRCKHQKPIINMLFAGW